MRITGAAQSKTNPVVDDERQQVRARVEQKTTFETGGRTAMVARAAPAMPQGEADLRALYGETAPAATPAAKPKLTPKEAHAAKKAAEDYQKAHKLDAVKQLAWSVGRIPPEMIDKVGPLGMGKLIKDLQKAQGVPGAHKIKVGSYDATFQTGNNGRPVDGTTEMKKRPGFWSKLGGFFKKVGGIALKVASFIPGPIGIAARVVNGVIGGVQAIKKGSVFGAIASAAGAFGAGIAGIGSKAAETVSRIANTASGVLHGVQSATSGGGIAGILGGAAGILGSVADGIGSSAQGLSDRLNQFARFGSSGANVAGAIQNRDLGGALEAGFGTAAMVQDDRGDFSDADRLRQIGDDAGLAGTAVAGRGAQAKLAAALELERRFEDSRRS